MHSPGVAPLTSTQGCAEPTAPSCPGMLPALPALPSSPPPPAIQDQRCSVLPRGGEFEQVQKAHEHPARDLHKRLCQNTARRGRRERKIKGADTTPFKMTDLKKRQVVFNSLLVVVSLISLLLTSPQVYLQV